MGITEVRSAVAEAAVASGREAGDVTLIAVSKVQPLARVEAILRQGHRVLSLIHI